ncbi:MAG: DUF2147 domain-containing protein [Thermonemataceae bacterium]|nr:DUF2147 domain-containing protein [Thermonemataceae bacterium]
MKKNSILWLLFLLAFSFQGFSQSIEGVWETTDDETGEKKSHVKMYKTQSGKYAGQVVKILQESRKDAVCDKCSDYRKGKPIQDMVIVIGMKEKNGEWSGGEILDPKKGKIYGCKMWLDGSNTLKVRGYLGPFYRTQTWKRVQ